MINSPLILSPRELGGCVSALPSKSMVLRLLLCASLADKETVIECSHLGDDIEAMIHCLSALGARISVDGAYLRVQPISYPPQKVCLDCGESGAVLRFLLPLLAALGTSGTIYLRGRLSERPLTPLLQELAGHGIVFSSETGNPLSIYGSLSPDLYTMTADISSQFASGLLLALPFVGRFSQPCPVLRGGTRPSKLVISSPVNSEGYIRMTQEALALFQISAEELSPKEGGLAFEIPAAQTGSSPGLIRAEGDYSGAAFWLCAGALSSHKIRVDHLPSRTSQKDREILSLLSSYGASVTEEKGEITVTGGQRRPLHFSASQIPDLVPPLALLAALGEGESVITDIGRLRHKESDRVEALIDLIRCLGGYAEAGADTLRIRGVKRLRGGSIDCRGDHRIAMTAAIASCVCSTPVILNNYLCVSKSYPTFFDDFKALTLCERKI